MKAFRHAAALAAAIFVSGLAHAEDDPVLLGIREGLSRSPDHFVAGILEVVSDPRCEGEPPRRSCVQKVEIVESLASRIVGEGETVEIVGERATGSRLLAFLIPVGPSRPGVYAATHLSFDTGGTARGDLERALRREGLVREE